MKYDINRILEIPEESQTIEFKRLNGDKVVRKVIQTIVAMANTDGGVLVLGVDDPEKTTFKGIDRVFGIEENQELYDEIFHEIQRIIPPISNINPELIKTENRKTVVILNIPKSTESFCSIDNNVWIRLRKSNRKLTPQEITKFSYAKGFEKADKELISVDFELLETESYQIWKRSRNIKEEKIEMVLFKTGLARKDEERVLKPTRAAVLLFAEYPTNLMDTKCTIRVYKYKGTLEQFSETPNLVGAPKTIDGSIVNLIRDAHEYVLTLLESGIEMHSGFVTKYKIPERAVKEGITNAVIHRDYHIKRDIEVKIFEDRIEILSPGLFPFNITRRNIGHVRADGYRNDLLVKHLREFPERPNLDRNEGVQAMRNEMNKENLFPPIFITYPTLEDSINLVLLNEERPDEWEKVREYLEKNKYINNKMAREITGQIQVHKMSRMLKKWVDQGLILKIETKNQKDTKYKLVNSQEIDH